MVIILFLPSFVLAEESPQNKNEHQSAKQIQIVADKLITHNEEKYAEFVGDVRASQGNFEITSDRLRIYYRDDLGTTKNKSGDQDLIKRIVASGNVKITSDKYVAETHRVEYDLDTLILVLTGENSTVKSGKNILTGSKITVYRKDRQIKVEGSPQKRVKAVFYSKEEISEGLQEKNDGAKVKKSDE
jgi:lipopolysaccharide export system protein LptA